MIRSSVSPLSRADDRWSLTRETIQHRGPLYHGPVLFRSFSFVVRFPGEYIPGRRIKNVNSENRIEKWRWESNESGMKSSRCFKISS